MSQPVPAGVPSRQQVVLPGLLIFLLIVAAYLPALRAGFVWDDDDYVTANSLLTAPDGLQRIWFSAHTQSQYFPLVFTTFRLEHALWGLNPVGYHAVNILLHGVNALLVWALLRRLRVPGAWLAAALFALHPVQVESVAWVTELKNTESTLFYLLTLWAWLKCIDPATVRPRRFYVFALVLYALALFAKTTACTLPAALLLILFLRREAIGRQRILQVLPFLGLGVAMGLVSIYWEKHLGNYHLESGAEYGWLERLLIATRAYWFYAGKLLWPTALTFSYPKWQINSHELWQYIWLAGCGAVAGVLWLRRQMLGRGTIAGVLFFVAMLSPMVGFIWLYTFRFSFVADHYQYLAGLGLMAVFAGWADRLTATWNKSLRCILSLALLLSLASLTWRQARVYHDRETLWRDTLAKNPQSWLACNHLGEFLMETGRADEAEGYFHKAIELNPKLGEAWNNLGSVFNGRGRLAEASEFYRKAVEMNTNQFEAMANLASILAGAKHYEEAVAYYERALQLKPDHPAILAGYGRLLLDLGQLNDATTALQAALHYGPQDLNANGGLARLYAMQGRYPEAIERYQVIQKLTPNDPAICYNLGLLLGTVGKNDEAIAQYERALRLRPDYAEAHNNLGLVLAATGKLDAAAQQFQEALRLDPNNAGAQNNLGYVLDQLGRRDEAIPHLQEALRLNPDNAGAKARLRELGVLPEK